MAAGQRSALLPTSPFRKKVKRGLTPTTSRLEGAYRVHGARAAASHTTALPAASLPWAVEKTERAARILEVRAAAGQRPTLLTAAHQRSGEDGKENEGAKGGGS